MVLAITEIKKDGVYYSVAREGESAVWRRTVLFGNSKARRPGGAAFYRASQEQMTEAARLAKAASEEVREVVREAADQDTHARPAARPWQWATIEDATDPVEIVSYPIPGEGGQEATINVRRKVGDPTSMENVSLSSLVEIFPPESHAWAKRKRHYYGDNPSAFIFEDELQEGK